MLNIGGRDHHEKSKSHNKWQITAQQAAETHKILEEMVNQKTNERIHIVKAALLQQISMHSIHNVIIINWWVFLLYSLACSHYVHAIGSLLPLRCCSDSRTRPRDGERQNDRDEREKKNEIQLNQFQTNNMLFLLWPLFFSIFEFIKYFRCGWQLINVNCTLNNNTLVDTQLNQPNKQKIR